MQAPRVSVIVPVCNAERYLPACLDSLLSQTHRDLDLIVVNDGSTDGSASILERYRLRDPRLTVVEQPNAGVSSARNAGLARATGEFTAFVDADDWASPEMLETLVAEAVAVPADIVMCTYMREYGNRSVEKPFDLPERVRYSPAETHRDFLRRLVGPLGPQLARPENLDSFGTVWGKLYRSALLRDAGLRFVDLREIGTNEDGLFNLHAFAAAGETVFLRKPLYHYRRHNAGSLTAAYHPGLREQWERLFERIGAFLRENAFPPDFGEALSNRKALSLFSLAKNVLHDGGSFPARYQRLEGLLEDEELSDAVRKLPLAFLPPHWRLFYFLAKRRLTLPFYLMLQAADAMI